MNELEAQSVVKELERLIITQGYQGSIGVVTPFRAQVNRIRDILHAHPQSNLLLKGDLLVDTVHRFQGDERDVIVFSPVVSNETPKGALSFLRGNGNLFNVAITRARAALLVVGDRKTARTTDVDYLSKFVGFMDDLDSQSGRRMRVAPDALDMGPIFPTVSKPELVSDWEKKFYEELYLASLRPIPQYEVEKYILDFALIDGERRLNIEVDGERYHRAWNGELLRRDQLRNMRMIELGWDVMRFWVYELRDDMPTCVTRVKSWMHSK